MAPSPNPASPPTRSFGRYVVYRELASGGMAAVFYARLLGPSGFGRTVAVKRPHPHLLADRSFALMLIDEARLASRIRHPNVVSTLDVIETPTELALAMEYVHGESLSHLVAASYARCERVPVPMAAAILIDALRGLHAAHEATDEQGGPLNIVHRDISPQNLLVGADGMTRIADFGIAKAAGRLMTTRDGAIKGKYAYMAPEQIRGAAVNRQTDIYAASIILWELLTGEGLFRGANEGEVIYKCLEGAVEAPSLRDPTVPKAFDAIVLRGLSRDPAARYATAREMAADIERAAPAVRPSEVAAWVERLAGEALAARASVIAEMEASAQGEVQPSAGIEFAVTPEIPSTDPRARVVHAERSQVSHAGVVVAERSQLVTVPARGRRRLIVGALAGFALLGAYGAFLASQRSPSFAGASRDADAPPPPVLSAPFAPPTSAVAEPLAPHAPSLTGAASSTAGSAPCCATSRLRRRSGLAGGWRSRGNERKARGADAACGGTGLETTAPGLRSALHH